MEVHTAAVHVKDSRIAANYPNADMAKYLKSLLYGKRKRGWLCRQWGVDDAKQGTPAHTMEDGVDYCPAKASAVRTGILTHRRSWA